MGIPVKAQETAGMQSQLGAKQSFDLVNRNLKVDDAYGKVRKVPGDRLLYKGPNLALNWSNFVFTMT